MKKLEDIRMTVSTDHMNESDKSLLDLITCSMTINLSFVKHRIGSNMYGGLVVTEEFCSNVNRDLQVCKQLVVVVHSSICSILNLFRICSILNWWS